MMELFVYILWIVLSDFVTVASYQLRKMACPYKCECDSQIWCAGAGLHKIPINLPKKTKTLDVSFNNISQVDAEVWELPNLQTIVLSYNKISLVSAGAFAMNSNLQDIQLQGNSLTSKLFKPSDWGDLKKLRSLNVAYNKLGPALMAEVFYGLTSLQVLDLCSNDIITIPEGTFQGLARLNELVLKSNKLSHVPSSALKNLSGLQTLDLSNNSIKALQKGSFPYLNSLDALLLNSMDNLTSIGDESFSCLPHLRVIQITHSPNLAYISGSAFKGLLEIKLVKLNGNGLQHLSEELLIWGKISDNKVGLYDNPWYCDCHIKWLTDNTVKQTLEKQERMVCVTPPQLKGLQLTTINRNAFVCNDQTEQRSHPHYLQLQHTWLTGDPKKDYENQLFPKLFAIVVPVFVCSSIFILLLGAYLKRMNKGKGPYLLRSLSYGSLQRDNYACTASNMDIPYESTANDNHDT